MGSQKDWNELTYITRLSIGTPPQHFHALLDISSSDLFVPATSRDELCPPGNRYNASASRTHKHHTEHMHSEYLRCLADGQLAEDTLHLGGIEIEGQKFGAAKSIIKPDPKFGNDDWDGILGLAPGNKGSFRNIANPFMNMIAQKKLDWNLFSLKLPRGKSDPGEIIFGGIDKDMYEGNLKKLPLVPYDPVHRRRLRDRWVVPASGIGIGHGYASLYGYVATIESDFPGIAIPELYALMLNKYLGMENRDGLREPPSIDCAKREKLEDLTITLAEEKFVLSPWDYTMEMDMGWIDGKKGERRCVSAFMSLPDHLEESFIVLGTPFLRKFYSVFDLGGRTVSCM
jgi:saccharopepsin